MCGIAGVVGASSPDAAALAAMASCLEHRGPDGGGIWADGPVGLAHRRLAVIDPSDSGAQPMHSASGRFTITYNGELYNHRELRRDLEGSGRAPRWRGASDTETLLACVESWGLDEFLQRSVGMFAFALWDREQRRVTLVRDRMGEKPLSWTVDGGALWFASQPSALRRRRGAPPSIDREALADLLRHAHIPGTRTIHHGVHKVAPGTLVEFTIGPHGRVEARPPRTWWSLADVARAARDRPLVGDDRELIDRIGATVTDAVRGQMLSDVPLGAFLSGGIDSSLVVATMQMLSPTPVRTFTIGFAERRYDESLHARAVASHLGTAHTELIVTPDAAREVIPELPHIYDEPFADASQLPTLLVSRLARGSVTVSLSGDGGDELFAGYTRYRRVEQMMRTPRTIALLAGGLFGLLGRPHDRTASLARGVDAPTTVRHLLSANPDADELVLHADPGANLARFLADWERTEGLGDVAERFRAFDAMHSLPDDILHKVDRAAMAVSLETRVPLLDHRVVEMAWRLPPRLVVRDGVGKWVLRELLARHLPRDLFERPKSGFAVPIGSWLRGPLRTWAEDLLASDAIIREGLLDATRVRRLWVAHLTGRRDHWSALWPILMFRSWSDAQGGYRTSEA
jgi:asparagine synthase (glutamine-hydrolysing)